MNTKILTIFLIVVVLAVSAYASECTTGDTKQVDCNTCRCLNGLWACTRRGCLKKRATGCSPGETKRDDCNTCVCANGNWACTLKACLKKRAVDCTEGETMKLGCNTCSCSDGRWACTLMLCPRRDIHPDTNVESIEKRATTRCTTGETKKIDCNTCHCYNGVWGCTLIGCSTYEIQTDTKVEAREKRATECSPGQTKRLDCNTCFCANGNWACTLKGCLRKRAAQECSTGETKKVECNNTCFCANGVWACTKIGCNIRAIPARFDQESRQKRDNHVADTLRDTPCAPNDYFALDCNTCYCNLERSGYLCTNNLCKEDGPEDNHQATTKRVAPMENDTLTTPSYDDVKSLRNATSSFNYPERIDRNLAVNPKGEATTISDDLLRVNITEHPAGSSNDSVASQKVNK